MTENALAHRDELGFGSAGVELRTMNELARFCQVVCESGLAPRSFDTPQKIAVAVQYGAEIGLSPMQSLQSMSVINGKPTLMCEAALALVMGSGLLGARTDRIEGEGDERRCVVQLERVDGHAIERSFSMADAKRANLGAKGGPWKDYPDRMIYNRAMAFALRDLFPDVLRGMGLAEEVQDWRVQTRKAAPSPPPQPADRALGAPAQEPEAEAAPDPTPDPDPADPEGGFDDTPRALDEADKSFVWSASVEKAKALNLGKGGGRMVFDAALKHLGLEEPSELHTGNLDDFIKCIQHMQDTDL